MCTYNTYWMSFDEAQRGSLETGKVADMVILSGNPYEVDVTKLDTLKVEQLLLKGEPYQKIGQNPRGAGASGTGTQGINKNGPVASPLVQPVQPFALSFLAFLIRC